MQLNFLESIRFYSMYFFYKFYCFFECKNYRIKIFLADLHFLMRGHLHIPRDIFGTKRVIKVKTGYGNFYIRDTLTDLIIISPSFERLDLEELMTTIKSSLHLSRKILFLDIGAHVGKYSVTFGNYFREFGKNLKIIAFEPMPGHFKLLRKNIKLNKLQNVYAFNIALSNENIRKPFYIEESMDMLISVGNTSKKLDISTKQLDQFIAFFGNSYDEIYIKMDVEGHEVEVLKGAQKVLDKYKKITLMVEDSVSSKAAELQSYLLKNFNFSKKITPQNSFWIRENSIQ